MKHPAPGAPAPAASLAFSPAINRSSVDLLKVTVQTVAPALNGALNLAVTSGNTAFDVSVSAIHGRPDFKTGDRLILEFPKGANPLCSPYSAIYHEHARQQKSIPARSNNMNDTNTITVADQAVRVVEYRGQRIVTFTMIDAVHKRPEGTAKRTFNENRHRLVEGEDFYELDQPDEIRSLGFSRPQGGTPAKVLVFTESGYLMLVKSFTDDLAWQVQRQLVNRYFRKDEPAPRVSAGTRASHLSRNQVAASILLLRSAAEDLRLAPSAVLGGYQRLEAQLGVSGLLPQYATDAPSDSTAGSSEVAKPVASFWRISA